MLAIVSIVACLSFLAGALVALVWSLHHIGGLCKPELHMEYPPPQWHGPYSDDEIEQTSLGQDERGKTSLD